MLKNLAQDSTPQTTSNVSAKPIPDPWELKRPAPNPETTPAWEVPTEDHPLIAPLANLEALPIPKAKAKPVQVLLQDWLKLKAEDAQQLAVQLQEALGLLCWMEQVT